MSVRSSQSITKVFTTRRFDTGAATNADSTPTGTLYVNGTADAASVTVTNITTGVYKAAVTLPTLAVGDVVDLRINATVNSVSDNATIWTDTKDIVIDSAGLADANTVKLGPSGSGTAQTARDIGASVLLSNGTGTGQVKLSSGYVAPNWGDVGNPTTSVALTGTTIATTQKVDVETIKTQSVTCGASVTVGAYVGGTGAAALASVWTTTVADRIDADISSRMATYTQPTGFLAATFPGTVASTTNITAGTITTVTNLTNLPSIPNDWITAAGIADGAIDRATFAADTGLQTVRSGTAQAGGAASITLDAGASSVTGAYVGDWVYLTGGTGAGQCQTIMGYNTTTKECTTYTSWLTTPDNTTKFAILPKGTTYRSYIVDSVIEVSGIGGTFLASFFNTDSGQTYGSAVAGSVVKEIADNAGGGSLTAADVWAYATRTLSGTVNDFDELVTELNSAHGAGSWATATGFATTEPDNAGISAIQAVTDQFVFTVANQVDANALTGGGGDSAWTEENVEEIRYLLGLTGDTAEPPNTRYLTNELATQALATIISNKLGAFAGSGTETLKGWLQALAVASAQITPAGLSPFDNTQHSLQALASLGRVFETGPNLPNATGKLIVQGCDYQRADGMAIEYAADTWPDLTDAESVQMVLQFPGGNVVVEGAVLVAGEDTLQSIDFQLTAAETADFPVGDVVAIVTATLASGNTVPLLYPYLPSVTVVAQ